MADFRPRDARVERRTLVAVRLALGLPPLVLLQSRGCMNDHSPPSLSRALYSR